MRARRLTALQIDTVRVAVETPGGHSLHERRTVAQRLVARGLLRERWHVRGKDGFTIYLATPAGKRVVNGCAA